MSKTKIPETTTYSIKQTPFKDSDRCICSHSFGAHGSNGKICCACHCKDFLRVTVFKDGELPK